MLSTIKMDRRLQHGGKEYGCGGMGCVYDLEDIRIINFGKKFKFQLCVADKDGNLNYYNLPHPGYPKTPNRKFEEKLEYYKITDPSTVLFKVDFESFPLGLHKIPNNYVDYFRWEDQKNDTLNEVIATSKLIAALMTDPNNNVIKFTSLDIPAIQGYAVAIRVSIEETFRKNNRPVKVTGDIHFPLSKKCDGDILKLPMPDWTPGNVNKLMKTMKTVLDAMHEKRLYHKDIKPANILYTENKGEVNFILGDFGLSTYKKQDDDDLDCNGTPYWIPLDVLNTQGCYEEYGRDEDELQYLMMNFFEMNNFFWKMMGLSVNTNNARWLSPDNKIKNNMVDLYALGLTICFIVECKISIDYPKKHDYPKKNLSNFNNFFKYVTDTSILKKEYDIEFRKIVITALSDLCGFTVGEMDDNERTKALNALKTFIKDQGYNIPSPHNSFEIIPAKVHCYKYDSKTKELHELECSQSREASASTMTVTVLDGLKYSVSYTQTGNETLLFLTQMHDAR